MVDGDLFREVEEDLRRERLKKAWDKLGPWIIGVALAIILGVAGFKGWEYWTERQAAQAGGTYAKAIAELDSGDAAQATTQLKNLAAASSGAYETLALLQLAGAQVRDGKVDDAIATYEQISGDSGADQALRSYARIRAASLSVGKQDWTAIKNRVNDLTVADNPWRHSAREVVALAAYEAGQMQEASQLYREILADQAPQSLRQRAENMLSLIVTPREASSGTENAETAVEQTN